MTRIFECGTCGVVTHNRDQLCNPEEREDRHSFCGTAPERGTMCDDMRKKLPYVCGTCGRPAGQADLVCKPLVTG